VECRAGDETSANLNLAQRDLPADFQIGADRPLLVEAFRCVSFHRSGYGVGVGLLFPGSCFSPPCGCCGCHIRPIRASKLVFGMIVTSSTSCHHVRMKIGPYIGCAVLVMVFGSAILGMLIRRKLPESHLSDESKGVVTLSMGVVGTLTALVLSLLIATASGTFNTRNQEITVIAAKVIQLDRLLRRFGPETASLRVLLRRYTAMRFQDLFPQGSAKPVLQNSNTITLFEDLEDQLAAMEGHNAQQRWLVSQAQALTADLTEVRWLLVEQEALGIPVPVLLVVLFWLCLLFMSFGLFAPRNATVTVVMFLCAIAVAGAIQTILDLSRPFDGIVRVSGKPLRQALDVINNGEEVPKKSAE